MAVIFHKETLIKRAKIIERLGYEAIVLRGYTCNLIKIMSVCLGRRRT